MHRVSSTRRLTAIALLSAVGIALFVLESYIPMPVPFLKIGLANISGIVALMLMGPAAMFSVVVIRVVTGSVMIGTFMGPAFMLALFAGIGSAIMMSLTKIISKNMFSAIGISLIGSVTHVIVQLLIVRYVYVQSANALQLLPILLITAFFGGLVVGWISLRLLNALKRIPL